MSPDRSEVDSKLEELAVRLRGVEQRLERLEAAGKGLRGEAPSPAERSDRPERTETRGAAEHIPLVGRTLLILGGGFVLRAITERGLLGVGMGVALGIVYAMVWTVLAHRAAADEKRVSAAFFGLSTVIIAMPLIGEATGKFSLLTPTAAVALLALVTAGALFVAWRHALRPLAWIITLGSLLTAGALAVATKDLASFAGFLLLLGLATLRLGDRHGWPGLGWSVAAAVDAVMILMIVIAWIAPPHRVAQLFQPGALVALLLALVAVYFGVSIYRTLLRRRDLTAAEMIQGLAAVAIGLGGALAVARRTGEMVALIGFAGLLLAASCYAAAFAFIDKRAGHRGNFIFFSTFGLLLTLLGFNVLLPDAYLAVALALAALFTASIGTWKSRATLSVHSAAYVLSAAVSSGMLVGAGRALFASTVTARAWITPVVWIVLLTAAVLCWLPVATHGRTWGNYSRLPKFAVLTTLALGLGGVLVSVGASLVPTSAESGADAAWVAVVRTGVLALSAVVLSVVARSERISEAGWLVYPVLIVGGLKLVLEDFPTGRPATLVLSLALYGGALVMAPRLGKQSHRIQHPSS